MMKEREFIRRTAFYLNLLDNGINPYTGTKIESKAFSDKRLKDSLAYAAKYLNAVYEEEDFSFSEPVAEQSTIEENTIESTAPEITPPEPPKLSELPKLPVLPVSEKPSNNETVFKETASNNYTLPDTASMPPMPPLTAVLKLNGDIKVNVEITQADIPAKVLAENINAAMPEDMKRVSPRKIEHWLAAQGILRPCQIAGVNSYETTELSAKYGVFMQMGFRDGGHIKNVVHFSSEGQRFIVEHMDMIMNKTSLFSVDTDPDAFADNAVHWRDSGLGFSDFSFPDKSMSVRTLCDCLNRVLIPKLGFSLTLRQIGTWLVNEGYLEYTTDSKRPYLCARSAEIGLESGEIRGKDGKKHVQILYTQQTAKYLIEHIYEIVMFT